MMKVSIIIIVIIIFLSVDKHHKRFLISKLPTVLGIFSNKNL